ncbi:MAG: hypothetical protein KDC92_00840 [Bacteroidetes bacterium]|nr:hypothetical protein [Bacteroidota bacterium]
MTINLRVLAILFFLIKLPEMGLAQDAFLLQNAFNSSINGLCNINGDLHAYGFYEKFNTDKAFADKNLIKLDENDVLEFIKISKRPQAEIMKIDKLADGSGYYVWLFHEFCQNGPNGNELIFFDSNFNQMSDSFFVYQNFNLIRERINDIVQLSNGNWLVSYGEFMLYLENNGRTIRQFKLGFKPKSVFKLKENRYFAFSDEKLSLISLSEVLETNEYGDSIIQIVRYDEQGTLFGLVMKKSFRYINEKGESRVSISAKRIGMDFLEAADFINDTTIIFGSSGKLKKQVYLDENDEVAKLQNVAYNLPGKIKYAFLYKHEWVFAVHDINQVHKRDYLIKWKGEANSKRYQLDLELDNPKIDSFLVDSASISTKNIGDVVLKVSYNVFNNSPDTIYSFNLHLGSTYGQNCDYNLITRTIVKEIRPYSKVNLRESFADYDIDFSKEYSLNIALSSPNNQVDTNSYNSAKIIKRTTGIDISGSNEISVYPNIIESGNGFKIDSYQRFKAIKIYNSLGNEVDYLANNSTFYLKETKNGFYLLEAMHENGSLFFARIIVY